MIQAAISGGSYIAYPLRLDKGASAVAKADRIIRETMQHESFFTDYNRACEDLCGGCEECLRVKRMIAATVMKPDAIVWEVWKVDEQVFPLDFVGILRLSRVNAGCDALAHYFFFDGRLSDKTELLQSWRKWTFEDHEGWRGLKRVTVEIPEDAFALARHAVKKLGFGGGYRYEMKGNEIPVEGVRRNSVRKNGRWLDTLVLGLRRED